MYLIYIEFKGPPDPLRGDEIYRRVRECARVRTMLCLYTVICVDCDDDFDIVYYYVVGGIGSAV